MNDRLIRHGSGEVHNGVVEIEAIWQMSEKGTHELGLELWWKVKKALSTNVGCPMIGGSQKWPPVRNILGKACVVNLQNWERDGSGTVHTWELSRDVMLPIDK